MELCYIIGCSESEEGLHHLPRLPGGVGAGERGHMSGLVWLPVCTLPARPI